MNDKNYMFIKLKELVELSQNFWKWLNQTFFFSTAENFTYIIVLFWQSICTNLIFKFSNGSGIARLPGVLKLWKSNRAKQIWFQFCFFSG